MINAISLIKLFKENGSNFFTGVPDSVLKDLITLLQHKNKKEHLIATNEGSAISIGVGHYLSTKKVPIIYMQNSGLSNALNPLISIAHKKVYSIPLILVIGWRGSPKVKDEPQHKVKGQITKKLLKLLNIRYTVVRKNSDLVKLRNQIKLAKKNKSIVACLIEPGTLKKDYKKKIIDNFNVDKEFFLHNLLKVLDNKTKIFSSTGYNSRELLYLREKYNMKNNNDFYMVGGMGHTTSVALGYSLFKKNTTLCIDGDGSLLMHMGSIKSIGKFANKNFKYILLNNSSHDSVGGQNTYADDVDFKKLSKSLGFKSFHSILNTKNLKNKIKIFLKEKKMSFLEVKIAKTKNINLPRPQNLINIKNNFMK